MKRCLKRIGDGCDVGVVLLYAIQESYAQGRRDERSAPFADETTPEIDLWDQRNRASRRPTKPPPVGALGPGVRTPTSPGMQAPPVPRKR